MIFFGALLCNWIIGEFSCLLTEHATFCFAEASRFALLCLQFSAAASTLLLSRPRGRESRRRWNTKRQSQPSPSKSLDFSWNPELGWLQKNIMYVLAYVLDPLSRERDHGTPGTFRSIRQQWLSPPDLKIQRTQILFGSLSSSQNQPFRLKYVKCFQKHRASRYVTITPERSMFVSEGFRMNQIRKTQRDWR